ncbi:hypothetical protein V6N13_118265 [Hibiscus sabdariffa]
MWARVVVIDLDFDVLRPLVFGYGPSSPYLVGPVNPALLDLVSRPRRRRHQGSVLETLADLLREELIRGC